MWQISEATNWAVSSVSQDYLLTVQAAIPHTQKGIFLTPNISIKAVEWGSEVICKILVSVLYKRTLEMSDRRLRNPDQSPTQIDLFEHNYGLPTVVLTNLSPEKVSVSFMGNR